MIVGLYCTTRQNEEMSERDEGNTRALFLGHVSKLKFLDVTFMPKTYVYDFFMHNYFSKVLG